MSDFKRAGVVKVSVNGQRVDVKAEGIRWGFGGVKLTEMVGADGMHGFSGEIVAPFIECTVTDHRKMDTEALLNMEDGTVTATLFNGKTQVLSNAHNTSDRTAQSSDGAIVLRWVGTSLKELKDE